MNGFPGLAGGPKTFYSHSPLLNCVGSWTSSVGLGVGAPRVLQRSRDCVLLGLSFPNIPRWGNSILGGFGERLGSARANVGASPTTRLKLADDMVTHLVSRASRRGSELALFPGPVPVARIHFQFDE